MMTIDTLLASPVVHRIGWALLHSLWQSAAVALLLSMLLRRLRRAPAEARYLAACFALVMMAALPALTSGILSPPPSPLDAAGSGAQARRPGPTGDAAKDVATVVPRSTSHPTWLETSGRPRALLAVLVTAWMIGVVALSLRLLGGWLLMHRIGRRTRPLAGPCDQVLARLARAMRIRRAVRLLESSLVQVPMVIGGFRPVILLPLAALTGLPPGQLEALLSHELAHIRRHDYLANLVQCAIEVLLFYHPAAWWASQVIRTERENCCDDMAVRACGDRLTYVRALAAMEGLRGAPRLCPAATGGPLLERIRRIITPEVESMSRLPVVSLGTVLMLASLLLVGASAPHPPDPGPGSRGDQDPGTQRRSTPGHATRTRTVFVPTFRSVSFRRDVQFQLTELVQKEIEKRTSYKVVGRLEDADTILEGTVNFADKNIMVENPENLPRQLTGTMQVSVNWVHNPPLDRERNREPTLVSETVHFTPELGETTTTAFYRTSQNLATQIVDAMERLASRERRARPSAQGRVGGRSFSEDPPSQEEVWKEVRKFEFGSPTDEVHRNNVRFEIEKIGEKVDPSKVYPLLGPCQRVHRSYKCTVTFDERRRPAELASFGKRAVRHIEVIYLDKDYLRRSPQSPATP